MSEKREIIFAYSIGKNKQFIQDFADKRNHSVSFVVNYLVDRLRDNKKLQEGIKLKIPASVKKSEATLQKWNAKPKE